MSLEAIYRAVLWYMLEYTVLGAILILAEVIWGGIRVGFGFLFWQNSGGLKNLIRLISRANT